MVRTIVAITEKQKEYLKVKSSISGLSHAEIMRQALDNLIDSEKEQQNKAFGILKNRKLNGVTYQRRVRKQW